VAERSAFMYRVFLSCSHRDKAWGKWLQGALEGYRVDKELVGRPTPVGPVPTTLRPIFRSREDVAVGHSLAVQTSSTDQTLTDQALAALQASQFLVVLCSPSAANSRHVNEHIRRFKALGCADRVIAVVIGGEPGDPARECVPPALRFKLGWDSELTDLRGETIVADARPQGDGKDLAAQKLVARLLGLDLDEIGRRAVAARKRHACVRNGVIAACLALIVACGGGLAFARHELSRNEALLDRTLSRATALTSKAVAMSKQLGVPRSLSVGLLEEAEKLFRDMAELGSETPHLRLRKASMLIELARNYAALGNAELPRLRATEADRLLQRLVADVAGNLAWRRDLSVICDELGDVLQSQGRFKEAFANYQISLAIATRLAADTGNTGNAGWQRDPAVNYIKVGDLDVATGSLDAALASYHVSFAIYERRAAADRSDARWQHGLLLSHEKIGDVLRVQGELDAALASYHAGRAIVEGLVTADPANADWQRRLSVSHVKIGDVLALVGKPDEAFASYHASNAIAERFAAADPDHAGWQNDLGISHERMGSVLEAQGDLVGALKEYRVSVAVASWLAAADPGHAGRQRTLGLAHEHIGDALRLLGDLTGALKAYDAKRSIIGRLAAADPGNVGWQYDLGISHARIGLVQEARGDFAAAVKQYEACLVIGSRLAAADPDNAGWMRDLAVSYGKLAAAHHRLGKAAQALAALRDGRDIMVVLVQAAPGFVQWTQDLAQFDGRIAALEGRAQVAANASPTMSSATTSSATIANAAGSLRLPPQLGKLRGDDALVRHVARQDADVARELIHAGDKGL
jgi:tetratricopeptide (TPR) repeat protein